MDPVVALHPDAPSTTSPHPPPDGGLAPDPVATGGAGADDDARTAAVLVGLLVATIPLATGYVLWAAPGGLDDWTRRVSAAPFDLVLLVITGWVLLRPALLGDLFRRRAVQVGTGALVAVSAVSLAAHPSWLGVAHGLRLLAGLAVLAALGRAFADPTARRGLLAAIAAVGTAQAVLGMVQATRGEAFGIEYLDYAGPLYPFGSSHAGRGGLTHPYHLAVLLVVAQGAALLGLRHRAGRSPLPWLLALSAISAGIGVTYTRAGAIGQVALVAALLLGRADRRALLTAAAAIVVGLGIGGLAFGTGWLDRGATTAGATGNIDSDRSVRLAEARELIEAEPLVGVGPGRYVDALAATDREELLPAHNLLAHQAAELGLAGGAVTAGLLALLALRVLRGGAWTAALVVPVVPFLLLDAFPYVFATGLAISAVWLGLVRASLEPVAEVDA
jgi:hypothetical protein